MLQQPYLSSSSGYQSTYTMDWNGNPQTKQTHPPAIGMKRPPDSDLLSEQPLAKRLELLSLRPPMPSPKPGRSAAAPALTAPVPLPGERMEVDNVVYIHSLDDELAAEPDDDLEGRVIFVPDIERKFTRIPDSVLKCSGNDRADDGEGLGATRGTSTELVLYSVPRALSVQEGQDSVRMAVIESRERLRLKQQLELADTGNTVEDDSEEMFDDADDLAYDPDAMDIE